MRRHPLDEAAAHKANDKPPSWLAEIRRANGDARRMVEQYCGFNELRHISPDGAAISGGGDAVSRISLRFATLMRATVRSSRNHPAGEAFTDEASGWWW
jgi:hypothetical protein